MPLPHDYLERTYAGVLGKLIGVYLGRPFEGWLYDRIMAELGEITGYVHEKRGVPLIVTDDDISGTFTFLRALADYDYSPDLTPAQIGQTWLNYIIERRTILWWGGLGNSTEHTAYLRLKRGIPAPQSGSIALNGKVVAEQIGSQIFIDGWAMIAPGDPARAAEFARRASVVSHDGEAVYGAQVIAAIEAQAYVERDMNKLIDTAVSFIPKDSVIYRMINDIREWHAEYHDWHQTFDQIRANYGYDKYGGNCHMVPNHGLIIMSLLHGNGDFNQSLMMVNTAGWDTDCNSGNVGCILGIRDGLATLEGAVDWRGPVADRLYLPTADGGSAISDAVRETYKVVNAGRKLAGLEPLAPKHGARFHFSLPGSVQGFQASATGAASLTLENVSKPHDAESRSLALHFADVGGHDQASAGTATFVPPDALNMAGYTLIASPALYPGQTVRALLMADPKNGAAVTASLYLKHYGADDQTVTLNGTSQTLAAGASAELTWKIPALDGNPIREIGVTLGAAQPSSGTVYLDYLTWDGAPDVTFHRPAASNSTIWRRAWVDATDQNESRWPEAYRPIQNEGRGMLIQGTRDWQDYTVTATITPHLANAGGIAARVQGLKRYYALLLCHDGTVELVKALDGEKTLASAPLHWELGKPYTLHLKVEGTHLRASLDGKPLFEVNDTERPLLDGAVALVCEEGRIGCDSVEVHPN
jgi:ADP-ribosylglycohydrolase